MIDMTRGEIKTYYENMATNQDTEWKNHALSVLEIIKKLEAYENADLIERSEVMQIIENNLDDEREHDEVKSWVTELMQPIPRFEPKGSDNND